MHNNEIYNGMVQTLTHFGNFLISINFGLLESDLLNLSLNWKTTLTLGFPVSHLLSKSVISSSFTWLKVSWSFEAYKGNVSWNSLPIGTLIILQFSELWTFLLAFLGATTKDDDYDREWHRCWRSTSLATWKLLRFVRIYSEYLFCVFCKARQRTVKRTGSKMKCIEHCDFHFCQPMKKFEFFGTSRATRQRHFQTSSTGDENGQTVGWCSSVSLSFIVVLLKWSPISSIIIIIIITINIIITITITIKITISVAIVTASLHTAGAREIWIDQSGFRRREKS